MAEVAEDRWGVRLFIRSHLTYKSGKGPKSDEEVRARAEIFSDRIRTALQESFPRAEIDIRIPQARYGSATVAHAPRLLFDSPTPWIECRDALSSFVDDWQEMMEAEWALQEGDDLLSAEVAISVSATGHPSLRLSTPTARSSAPSKPNPTYERIMRAIKLREKMMWTFLVIGLAAGSLGGAALAFYVNLRHDLDELRSAPVSVGDSSTAAPPVVISYPPYPPHPPIVREPQERCDDCPVIRRVP